MDEEDENEEQDGNENEEQDGNEDDGSLYEVINNN